MRHALRYGRGPNRAIPRSVWVVLVACVGFLATVFAPTRGLWFRFRYTDLHSGDEKTVLTVLGLNVRQRVTTNRFSRALRQYIQQSAASPLWVSTGGHGSRGIEDDVNGQAWGACHSADLALEITSLDEPARRDFVSNVARLLAAKQYGAIDQLSIRLMKSGPPSTKP